MNKVSYFFSLLESHISCKYTIKNGKPCWSPLGREGLSLLASVMACLWKETLRQS